MTLLETYLNRATRGVWGKKKLEVKAELRGSIEARAWKLECLGFTPELALETAMRELGEPKAIAAGLTKVHTMPTILKSTLALGMFLSIAITSLNSSRAQIEVTTLKLAQYAGLEKVQVTPQSLSKSEPYFLQLSSIKRNLEAAGIAVDDTPQGSLEGFVNQRVLVPTLRFTLPGSVQRIVVQSAPAIWKSETGELEWNRIPPKNIGLDRYYVPFWSFVEQLQTRSGLPVRLEGWRNPTLKVGTTNLQIGSATLTAQPWAVYFSLVMRNIQHEFPDIQGWTYDSNSRTHGIRTNAPTGTVYAVMSNTLEEHFLDVGRVADDGVLYFEARHAVLEFVNVPLEVIQDRVNVGKRGYGSSSRPAKALLIRISSDLKTSFELPARVRSGALN
jgi:hypothetical protein